MEIEGIELTEDHYFSPVTYVPNHAEGNAGHEDCEQGVLVSFNFFGVRVLNCKTRTIQSVNEENLVWG